MEIHAETIGDCTLFLGDCRDIMPTLPNVEAAIVDPPYGTTSLDWDQVVDGWKELIPSKNLWCFGSLKNFLAEEFPHWKYAQEIVWEKHNGSGFHADRFKRVHEFAVQFYKGNWADIYKSPVKTPDATARTVRRKKRPAHCGNINSHAYTSEDGGPRMMRSVIYARSCHGHAEHPTQKPIDILTPLIEYSAPVGGTILDCFMGSGSTGIACKTIGRKFIGIEKNPAFFDIACRRISEVLI